MVIRLAAFGVLVVALAATATLGGSPEFTISPVVQYGVAAAFAVCGLATWQRRPRDVTGPLMLAVGLTWLAHFLLLSRTPVWFTAGALFGIAPFPILIYLVLAFPQGRLAGRWNRLVAAGVTLAWVLDAGFVVFFDARDYGCGDCTSSTNLLLIAAHKSWVDAKADVLTWLLPTVLIAFVLTLLVRGIRATPVARRVLAPLYAPSAIWALAYALYVLIPRLRNTDFVPGDTLDTILLDTFTITLLIIPVAFLYGIHRARGRHAQVSVLVRELGTLPSLSGLQNALSRALGDPSLELGLATGGGYVGTELQPLRPPGPGQGNRTSTVLHGASGPVALLVHDRALLLDDRELLEAVAAAAGLAVQNEQLQEAVTRQMEELRESRSRIVAAGDEARRRIERNLHDGAQQRLVSLLVALRLAELQAGDDADEGLHATLAEMNEQVNAAIDELRDLARGLHPAVLAEKGLPDAISALAERAALPVQITRMPDQRMPGAVEAAAYYVVAEALTNAARHARADRATVDVECHGNTLRVEVADDGRGGASLDKGTGLRGLLDRVEAAGGTLEVDSPVGRGTRVRASLPVGTATAAARQSAPVG